MVRRREGISRLMMDFPAHWHPTTCYSGGGQSVPGAIATSKGPVVCSRFDQPNPHPQAGYIVAFVPFEDGKPANKWEVFADGFTGL